MPEVFIKKQIKVFVLFLSTFFLLTFCKQRGAQHNNTSDSSNQIRTYAQSSNSFPKTFVLKSLLGKRLTKPPMSEQLAQRLTDSIEVLQKRYIHTPTESNAIWYGRHLAYDYQFDKAFAVYTKALAQYPKSYKLYRHRGHRYISVRKFDEAIADFTKAAKLAKEEKTNIEPDGFPNKLNTPLTTTQFNIWYHLGLAYYLKGQYNKAIEAYLHCQKYSNNDDTKCSTSDWLYMAYRRNGEKAKAVALLKTISKDMVLIESSAYHKRLLMYKGEILPDSLLKVKGEDSRDQQIKLATQGYGVGNWFWYNAHKHKAKEVYKKVLETKNWSAFGYIAAEVDIKNTQ